MARIDRRKQNGENQVNVAGNAKQDEHIAGSVGGDVSGQVAVGQNITQTTHIEQAHFHMPGAQAVIAVHEASVRGRLFRGVPQRNPIFTGREEELSRLHDALQRENTALTPMPQALQGLGGIGKTQTAVEYVHRYQEEYEGVFWVIGETPEQLTSQLAGLAGELGLPIAEQAGQDVVLAAVHRWFGAHSGWLLVVDNAENLPALKPLLPLLANGRLLLTTREKATGGLAQRVEIERLDKATGALLLLRRAGMLRHDAPLDAADLAWQEGAKEVSHEVDGLPLALDQAGAYIESRETTPAQYLAFYRQRRPELQQDYKNPDHASVAVTFSLALERVKQTPKYGKAAAELARVCSFLAPDAIPDEIFTTSASELGEPLSTLAAEPLEWTEVCAAACRYALLRRETDPPGLWMHRLAQEVVRNSLPPERQREVSERAVRAVNAVFPKPDYRNWPLCEHLLPHALQLEPRVKPGDLEFTDAGELLYATGLYLNKRARYKEAERLYNSAIFVLSKTYGEDHLQIAIVFNSLAALLIDTGRPSEAEPFVKAAQEIHRHTVGEQHPWYALSRAYLAWTYRKLNRIGAEQIYSQAIAITEQALGPHHRNLAEFLEGLALLFSEDGRYAEAIELFWRSEKIILRSVGDEDPDYARCQVGLAGVYVKKGQPNDALPLLEEAHSVLIRAGQAGHHDMARCLFYLGRTKGMLGDQATAITHLEESLEISIRIGGPDSEGTQDTREWLEKVRTGLSQE